MTQQPKNIPQQHAIRLRGPCALYAVKNGKQVAQLKVQIPCELSVHLFKNQLDHEADCWVLTRNFSKPTGLLNTQQVRLELKKFTEVRRVLLNRDSENEAGLTIAKNGANDESWSAEISQQILHRNTLKIEFGSMPAVAGEIVLLIDE